MNQPSQSNGDIIFSRTLSVRQRERVRKILVNAQNKEQNSTPLINTWELRRGASAKVSLAAVRAAKLIDAIIAHPFHFTREPSEKKRRERRIYLSICGLSFLALARTARDKNLSNNLIIMKTMKRVSSQPVSQQAASGMEVCVSVRESRQAIAARAWQWHIHPASRD
jgi:hypothetical protein